MASVQEIVRKCIKLASKLEKKINEEKFLDLLSDDPDNNYLVFTRLLCECSDTMLGVLYQLGYFGDNERIWRIAVEIVEMRRIFEHEEEDVGGHIANLLAHLSRGKYYFDILY